MKSTLAFAVFAVLSLCIASCSNETTTNDMSQLPEPVKNVITQHFNSDVISATIETNTFGADEYEVILANGSKVKFEGEEWEEVSVPAGESIPDWFIVAPIKTYVAEKHPGQTVVKVERDKKGYEVKLSNGLEIDFDTNGTFVKMD